MVKYNDAVEKPQLHFKDLVDNSETPFVPRLKVKHNALVDWNVNGRRCSLLRARRERGGAPREPVSLRNRPFVARRAPSLDLVYPDWELRAPASIEPPRPESETPLVLVETESALQALVETLKQEQAIAVDLEHHSYRSYQGFTCLLQISTRSTDYLVDVLAIREFVWELNAVFSDPAIAKVLHGADMDVQWLQKDFGVYLVGPRTGCSRGEPLRHGPRGARAGLRVLRTGLSAEAVLRRDGQQGVPAGRLAVRAGEGSHAQSAPADARDAEVRARRHALPAVPRRRAARAAAGAGRRRQSRGSLAAL